MTRFILRLFSTLAALPRMIAATAMAAVHFVMSTVAPQPMRFAFGGPDMPLRADGVALGRSLQQSMRHEAGVSRRSAARNT